MTELQEGKVYTALRVRSGANDAHGHWELIAVRDSKGKNEVTIYTRNIPSGVKEGQKFNLERIHRLKFGYKQDRDNRWQPQVTIDGTVKPIESEYDAYYGDEPGVKQSEKNPWDDVKVDDDLPWNDMAADELPL